MAALLRDSGFFRGCVGAGVLCGWSRFTGPAGIRRLQPAQAGSVAKV